MNAAFRTKQQEDFIVREIFGMNMQKLSVENINHNKDERKKLLHYIDQNLSQHQVITNQTAYYYDKLMEIENVLQIAEIYMQEKGNSYKVKHLLNRLRLLQGFHHTQSISFRKLDNDYNLYVSWARRTTNMFEQARCQFKVSKILKRLKKFKEEERAAESLSQL